MEAYEEKHLRLSEFHFPFSAFINKSFKEVTPHWHNYIELLYVVAGTGVIYIGPEKYTVYQGDFLIIHSGEIHRVEEGRWEILVIQFNPSLLHTDYDELYESQYFISFIQKKLKYSRHICIPEGDSVVALLMEIQNDFSDKYSGYELNIKGNIYKLFAWLLRRQYILLPTAEQVTSLEGAKIRNVVSYVREHYQEKISDKLAARISLMSYHYFCRTFKKVTGKTFVEYVHFIRLCEAEKLLTFTDKNITEISAEVGFSSCSYFSRLFKKEKGISPMSYRKAQLCKK